MFESHVPQTRKRSPPVLPATLPSPEPKQQRLMAVALALLVICLVFVLYRDRDFWFPDTEAIADQPLQNAPAAEQIAIAETKPQPSYQEKAYERKSRNARKAKGTALPAAAEESIPPVVVKRTVLPPLEVEVVAGSTYGKVRPSNDSLNVDVAPSESVQAQPPAIGDDGPARITTNAASHVDAIAGTDVVSHSVQPGYPMLARQMKVEGSVILHALIGRDGKIQDLHVVSGPPILAEAAREAVKQWHFKPHFEGAESVETQAKITVNFIISTD